MPTRSSASGARFSMAVATAGALVTGVVLPPVGVAVTGEVDGNDRAIESEGDGVPRVGVLATAVQQHDFRCGRTPHEGADVLATADVDRCPAHLRGALPGQPHLGGVLLEHRELVVGHGHTAQRRVSRR